MVPLFNSISVQLQVGDLETYNHGYMLLYRQTMAACAAWCLAVIGYMIIDNNGGVRSMALDRDRLHDNRWACPTPGQPCLSTAACDTCNTCIYNDN